MTDHRDQDDRMQALLSELRQAERAKVFEPTPVLAGQLAERMRKGSQPSRARRLLIGLQAAACVALVVGVASWWQLGQAGSMLSGNAGGAGSCSQAASLLAGCLAGPTGAGISGGCGGLDYDTDGDVDLADFGAYQRSTLTGG